MGNKGRFNGCESDGFPEVNNYDYETNIPIRGVDNRDFRWEETAVESVYMLDEVTVSGSFEDNTLVVDNSLTLLTGINYISTGNVGNHISYLGWTITGSDTVYIGIDGIRVYSGDLTNLTGSFQAHPIDGNEAIGLYVNPSITPLPAIVSNLLYTGSQEAIIPDGNHQVYLQAKLNYGSTGTLKVYLRGYESSAVVAYYDPFNTEWIASAPTGLFYISGNGYTEVCYDFSTSVFPAAIPTGYDLYITSTTTGSFITVDDIHIDAYMKKNAFIDYLVPTGYMLQITPDLGWHNIMELFEGTDKDFTNPHLKTLGPYEIELGNLIDNLDNSVTAILDSNDLKEATTNNFKKYLWRALPITPNGQVGAGGYPQRFEYIGDELNLVFSVNPIEQDQTSAIRIITGTKSKRMKVRVDDIDEHTGLEYPTDNSWKLTIYLTTSKRTVTIQGYDSGGGLTSIYKVNLENELYLQNDKTIWNIFDEHGLVTDLQRLPKESNHNFTLRIKDAYSNRGSSSFYGIVNGATRELGLNKINDGIEFSLNKDEYNNTLSQSALIEITASSVRLRTSSMIIEERLLVDNIHNIITLSYLPFELPEFIELDNAEKINITLIEDEVIFDDTRSVYRYKINKEVPSGTFVNVKYNYSVEFLYKDYPTLAELLTAINNYREGSNKQVISASLSSKLSGNESCLGIYVSSITLLPTTSIFIPWSPVYIKRLADRGFRDYFVNNNTELKDTKYYTYIKEIKNQTKIFWGTIEADRDRWDCADSKELSMDSIPTLFDPSLTRFISMYTGAETRIEAVTNWGRNQLGFNSELLYNYGITNILFQPGVAHTNDLRPSIYTTFNYINTISSLEDNVGPLKNNNNEVLFSGQR